MTQIDGPEYDAHRKWKKLAAPMYDWLTNHHMTWPGLACRFGHRKLLDHTKYEQTIFYSDQVGQDEKASNKLVKQVLLIPEEGYSPMDHLNSWKENQKSPYFEKSRHIINHPGDCNKIMEIKQAQEVVVTHGDCEDVFLWNFARQPNHSTDSNKRSRSARSVPDLRLVGHEKQAPFALSSSTLTPSVASGGEDKNILVWNIQDYGAASSLGLNGGSGATPGVGDTLQPRAVLSDHSNTVTSVCFKPGRDDTLFSTADDQVLKVWDVRSKSPATSVQQATDGDVMCSDWSAMEHYVATGADHGKTHVYDLRMIGASGSDTRARPCLEFTQFVKPTQAVLTVAWNPRHPYWLASSGDDGRVCVYDTKRESSKTADGLPSQLVLQHIGHVGNIMDCQWSPYDDFMIMSTSNDSETYKEGGALQLWRLSWLLHKPLEEAQLLLSEHQTWLTSLCLDRGEFIFPHDDLGVNEQPVTNHSADQEQLVSRLDANSRPIYPGTKSTSL